MQKLSKQKKILLGEELKDLGLAGGLGKQIIVVGCPAAANMLNSHISKRNEKSSIVLGCVFLFLSRNLWHKIVHNSLMKIQFLYAHFRRNTE